MTTNSVNGTIGEWTVRIPEPQEFPIDLHLIFCSQERSRHGIEFDDVGAVIAIHLSSNNLSGKLR